MNTVRRGQRWARGREDSGTAGGLDQQTASENARTVVKICEFFVAALCKGTLLVALAAFGLPQMAAAQNLIPDPTFSVGVSAWTIRGILPARVDLIPAAGADGTLGFARLVALSGGPGSFFGRTCLPAQAGKIYSWGGFLRTDPSSSAKIVLYFYEDSSCSSPTQLLSTETAPLFGGDSDPGTWYARFGQDVAAPAKATSAAFEVDLISPFNRLVSVDFDNVYFGPQGTRAPVGVSVPTLSVPALLLLAAALGAAGLWRLAGR